jgi:hypothetical protein
MAYAGALESEDFKVIKFQISSTKSQIDLKFQYPMSQNIHHR